MFEEIHDRSRALSGMGQIIPPIGSEAVRNVVLASVGIVAVSVAFYFLFGRKKPSATPTIETK